jgi:hypothetical protein
VPSLEASMRFGTSPEVATAGSTTPVSKSTRAIDPSSEPMTYAVREGAARNDDARRRTAQATREREEAGEKLGRNIVTDLAHEGG